MNRLAVFVVIALLPATTAVSQYVTCLDQERSRIMAEAQQTADRYDRFLEDSKGWDIDE